jgi:hypothetical protein
MKLLRVEDVLRRSRVTFMGTDEAEVEEPPAGVGGVKYIETQPGLKPRQWMTSSLRELPMAALLLILAIPLILAFRRNITLPQGARQPSKSDHYGSQVTSLRLQVKNIGLETCDL